MFVKENPDRKKIYFHVIQLQQFYLNISFNNFFVLVISFLPYFHNLLQVYFFYGSHIYFNRYKEKNQ